MLDMRLAHAFQTLVLDELRDTREPRPHVFGQGLNLRIDGFIEGLDRPAHILTIPKTVYFGQS